MGLLADILAQKVAEVETLLAAPAPTRPAAWPIRDVLSALRRPAGQPLRLIAEIKFRSPSAGALSTALSAAERAVAYEDAGATMISVLTDARWFDGHFDHLAAARERVGVPLLCKDYLVHPVQVQHAFARGADAALIIVRCIPRQDRLYEMLLAALERGVEPFVEVSDEAELERALDAGARLIGVNARDLDTLQMDAARAERVLAMIPSGVVAVHLSGLKSPEQAQTIAGTRADAVLLGEALMRQDDPRDLLGSLVRAVA
jgi:indole-3-glycerol phosphate synthase